MLETAHASIADGIFESVGITFFKNCPGQNHCLVSGLNNTNIIIRHINSSFFCTCEKNLDIIITSFLCDMLHKSSCKGNTTFNLYRDSMLLVTVFIYVIVSINLANGQAFSMSIKSSAISSTPRSLNLFKHIKYVWKCNLIWNLKNIYNCSHIFILTASKEANYQNISKVIVMVE